MLQHIAGQDDTEAVVISGAGNAFVAGADVKELLEIVIDAQGRYFIDQQQVVNTELDTLKRAIQKYLGKQTDLPVVIRADRSTPYESVVRAMDATAQLGLVKMSLATSKPASGGE